MNKPLAFFDIETDPFNHGTIPEPFATGFLCDDFYSDWWGEDTLEQFVDFLKHTDEEYMIYAHNGGKFDFIYLYEMNLLSDPIKIINGRIVEAQIFGHTLRDSYAILPIPLALYKKDEINYDWFYDDVRDIYQDDILHYLNKDCVYLKELVTKFVERYGTKLTIGGTAIKILQEMHPFKCQGENHDDRFRPYYYGGRVECFEAGIVRGNFKVYDVNSMYPYVMHSMIHPTGNSYIHSNEPDQIEDILNSKGKWKHDPDRPFFITVWCNSGGAFPWRNKKGELSFPHGQHIYKATHHEFQTAIKLGLISNVLPLEIWIAKETIQFTDYVNRYICEKIEGKRSGLKWMELIAKLFLNSPYGKLAANPRNYKDWTLVNYGEKRPVPREDNNPDNKPDNELWEFHSQVGRVELWNRPSQSHHYYDVATAASITGASRAILMEGIFKAKRPLYCDTDSIICEQLQGVPMDEYALGSWALEGKGDRIGIAGKKLYAVFKGNRCIKMASKGARLTGEQILTIASGGEIEYRQDAPSFKLNGEHMFIERDIKATIKLF